MGISTGAAKLLRHQGLGPRAQFDFGTLAPVVSRLNPSPWRCRSAFAPFLFVAFQIFGATTKETGLATLLCEAHWNEDVAI